MEQKQRPEMAAPAWAGLKFESPLTRLHELAERYAEAHEGVEAIADERLALTGPAFADAVRAAGQSLREKGVRPGDRILLINENCIAAATAILAASAAGAWVAPVNARHTAAELEAIAEHYQPHLTLYTVEASPSAQAHARAARAREIDFGGAGAIAACPGAGGVADEHPDSGDPEVAVVIYTSGTTGTPKGVMLTHRNLLFNAWTSGVARGFTSRDRIYGLLPVSHVFGLGSVLMGALYHQARLLMTARFDVARTAHAFAQEGISVLNAVPTVFTRLVEHAAARGGVLPAPHLRYISAGGGPLNPTLKREVEALLNLPLHNGYGLSETSPTALITQIENPAADTSVGVPVPQVEVRIVDPDSLQPVPRGETGELWLRGPNVMKGYYRDRALSARTLLEGGWLRTGDLARVGEGGQYYIVDRMKEVIIRSGFNVYPAEVEAALKAHPAVVQCAVVGVESGESETIVAFVEPRPGASLSGEEIEAHMRGRLAPYKQPGRYVFMDELPTVPTGKIRRAALRELARKQAALEE